MRGMGQGGGHAAYSAVVVVVERRRRLVYIQVVAGMAIPPAHQQVVGVPRSAAAYSRRALAKRMWCGGHNPVWGSRAP